jgi:predicted enzyme related to lactoylglutathione lyase
MPFNHTIGVYVQINNQLLEFLHPLVEREDQQYGITHIAFATDSMDYESCRLIAKGYKFHILPRLAGSGTGKMAFLLEPQGAEVELIERNDLFFLQYWPMHGDVVDVDHVALYTEDLSSTTNFFIHEFAFELFNPQKNEDYNANTVFINHGKKFIRIIRRESSHIENSLYAHIALRVLNVEKLVAKLSAQGIKITEDVKVLPSGKGHCCTVVDPNGIELELIDRPSLFELIE